MSHNSTLELLTKRQGYHDGIRVDVDNMDENGKVLSMSEFLVQMGLEIIFL